MTLLSRYRTVFLRGSGNRVNTLVDIFPLECSGRSSYIRVVSFVGVMEKGSDKQGFIEIMVPDRDSGENNQGALFYPPDGST
jgi:hypothetical protein